jgi:hypothetical protein
VPPLKKTWLELRILARRSSGVLLLALLFLAQSVAALWGFAEWNNSRIRLVADVENTLNEAPLVDVSDLDEVQIHLFQSQHVQKLWPRFEQQLQSVLNREDFQMLVDGWLNAQTEFINNQLSLVKTEFMRDQVTYCRTVKRMVQVMTILGQSRSQCHSQGRQPAEKGLACEPRTQDKILDTELQSIEGIHTLNTEKIAQKWGEGAVPLMICSP